MPPLLDARCWRPDASHPTKAPRTQKVSTPRRQPLDCGGGACPERRRRDAAFLAPAATSAREAGGGVKPTVKRPPGRGTVGNTPPSPSPRRGRRNRYNKPKRRANAGRKQATRADRTTTISKLPNRTAHRRHSGGKCHRIEGTPCFHGQFTRPPRAHCLMLHPPSGGVKTSYGWRSRGSARHMAWPASARPGAAPYPCNAVGDMGCRRGAFASIPRALYCKHNHRPTTTQRRTTCQR